VAVKKGRTNAAADILADIADLVPAPTPKSSGREKWEIKLSPDAQADLNRWLEAKTLLEPTQQRVENSKEEVNAFCLREMAGLIFKNKSKPSNPEIKVYKADGTVDSTAVFLMSDKFKYRFPDVPEGVETRDHFVDLFKSLGLHPSDAERLVDEELDFSPIVGFKTLTELLEGHYGEGREWIESTEDEKAVGRKLAGFLRAMPGPDGNVQVPGLTPQEKAIALERGKSIKVKQGFYNRVATYVQSADQLLAVFKVIVPIVYPAYPKYALHDSPTDQLDRKIKAAADILGTETKEKD
jgi:hypothetical protein